MRWDARPVKRGRIAYFLFTQQILAAAQLSLNWIFADVALIVRKLFFAAHDVIVALLLPNRALPIQKTVQLMSSESLPRMQNLLEAMSLTRAHQHMDVIGHDHPRAKFVAIARKMTRRIREQRSRSWI